MKLELRVTNYTFAITSYLASVLDVHLLVLIDYPSVSGTPSASTVNRPPPFPRFLRFQTIDFVDLK